MVEQSERLYEFGQFHLDPVHSILLHGEQSIPLAPKVFETLLLLVQRHGSVIEKEEFLREIWPDSFVEVRELREEESAQLTAEALPDRAQGSIAEEEAKTRWDKSTPSLAVLPLLDMIGDEDAKYLCEGITEGIINCLSQLPQLHVMARSAVLRYKGREVDPQEVGRELGTSVVFTGRVLQLSGRLIIKTELVDVANGWNLWSEQYNRDPSDLMELQEELSKQISEKLRLALTVEQQSQLTKRYTNNAEAFQLYLRGRYYSNKHTTEDHKKSIQCFEQAIDLDSQYPLAYSGMADSYITRGFHRLCPPWEHVPKAKAAAVKALELNDTLAEAHTSLACVIMLYQRDWVDVEEEFKRAIELNPRYAPAHSWYSHFLLAMGRIEESYVECQRALEFAPLDPLFNQQFGWHFIHARYYDEAIEQLQNTIALDTNFFMAHLTLGMAYGFNGSYLNAIETFHKASLIENTPLHLAFLGHAYVMAGDEEKAQKILEELEEKSERAYVPAYSLGMLYAAMGRKQVAFASLKNAAEDRNEWIIWLKVSSALDPLRSDPRYKEMLEELGIITLRGDEVQR